MEFSSNIESVSNEALTSELKNNLAAEVASIPAGLLERALFIQECDQDHTYLSALVEAVREDCRGEKQSDWASGDVGYPERLVYELERNLPAEIQSVEAFLKNNKEGTSLMESLIENVHKEYEQKVAAEEKAVERANATRYKITYLPNGVRECIRVK
jgi:hypothetical protein